MRQCQLCIDLHPNPGHSVIIMQLQKLDPILSIRNNIMRLHMILNGVTMLTTEELTKGPGSPPVIKGSFGILMGPKCRRRLGLESTGNPWVGGSVCL